MDLAITHVTVHRDGAVVTRGGRATPTERRLAVGPLPLLLDASSLVVRADGAAVRAVRLGLDITGLHRGPAPELRRRLAAAERAVRAVELELQSLDVQLGFISGLEPASPDPEQPLPDADRLRGWVGADEVLARWGRDVGARRPALERALEERVAARDALRLAMAEASGEGVWRHVAPTRRVEIELDTDEAVDLTITYRVPGATWTPAYTLYVDDALQRGRLAMRALVAQDSGEDWRGVALALSTAPVARDTDAPTLRALRLGRAQPPRPSGWRPLPADLDALFPADLEPGAIPRERAAVERATALSASWSENTVEVLDTAVPVHERGTGPRRGRLAAPSTPPGLEVRAPEPEPADDDLMFETFAYEEDPSGPLPPPAPAMAPPSLPPTSARMPPLAKRSAPPSAGAPAPAGAAAPRAAPRGAADHAPDPADGVRPNELDYAALRLAGWDAAPGRRGRLRRPTLADEAVEAGAPPAAAPHLDRAAWALRRRAADLPSRPLPAHHVLPGPIGGRDHRYEAVAHAEIPADGRFHSVSALLVPLELDVRYRAVPREDPRVFRRLEARMAAGRPLLPGPVDVVVDGTLEVTTPWAGSGQDTPLRLDLGAEDRLRLARNVRYREESRGMFGGERRVHTEVEVRVASALPREVRVELLDRVPVAATEGVRVELEGASPEARKWRGEPDGELLDGGLLQELRLPPGGEAVATLHWHLTLSSKLEVEGGERRG